MHRIAKQRPIRRKTLERGVKSTHSMDNKKVKTRTENLDPTREETGIWLCCPILGKGGRVVAGTRPQMGTGVENRRVSKHSR